MRTRTLIYDASAVSTFRMQPPSRPASTSARQRTSRDRSDHSWPTAAAGRSARQSWTALRQWPPLTSARWTLVDKFERGGARYVVARENRAAVGGLASLSDRERQVVAYLAIGQSTKETAYVLELSDATVRVLIRRAASKLGVTSRASLLGPLGTTLAVHPWVSQEKREETSAPRLWVVRSEPAMSGGRPGWTLVHHYERNGHAYIVARRPPGPSGVASLTDRERQVVARLARGETTKEAAHALGISDATVRVLLCRAACKLGTTSRHELLARPDVQRLRETG